MKLNSMERMLHCYKVSEKSGSGSVNITDKDPTENNRSKLITNTNELNGSDSVDFHRIS